MKKAMVTVLAVTGLLIGGLANSPNAEAATKVLPDNHTIQELKVEWRKDLNHGFLINVGDRKGTLLIRVDQPKVETNVEWVNWSITKPSLVSFNLNKDVANNVLNSSARISYFGLMASKEQANMKFSDFNVPNYYAGLAMYLPKKYNDDGVYWFGGNAYALREPGQVKAYFFHDVNLVEEAINRVGTNCTFPLMNKVMWGKTELWKGQLGKVTIKSPTTLWKRLDNGQLEKVRELSVGDEYRVYRYLDERKGLYGVGAGMYVERNTASVLYETPSKRNLRLVKIMHGEQ